MNRRHFLSSVPAIIPLSGALAAEKPKRPNLSVYLPDYRVGKDFTLNLYGTTHLILFSTAAKPDGSIDFSRMTAPLLAAGKEARDQNGCMVLFCVGGWGRSKEFASAVETPEKRNRFIQEAIDFCELHSLDGIDLDWEFPDEGLEMVNYQLLIRDLSLAMRSSDRILTVALGPTRLLPIETYPDIDLVHLMSYQPWNPEDYEGWMTRSVKLALDGGIPPEKISVGTPFFSKELGGDRRAVSYRKIAEGAKNVVPTSEHKFTPVGADAIDPRIRQIQQHGLAGAMVWDYGHDSMDAEKSMLRQLSEKLAGIHSP